MAGWWYSVSLTNKTDQTKPNQDTCVMFFNPIVSIITELCGTPGYLAPEVLAVSMYEGVSGYRHAVDMWAIGVIMYTLLCGAPPFWHRKQMQMLRMIMQANYSFGTPEWDDISPLPKDLV